MAKYRKVDPRIWNDEKFRGLSERGKLVFFFLLTHPHMTSLGAMRATVQGFAAEYGVPEKAFRIAFAEVLTKGMAEIDEEAHLVCLPRFILYNAPESPNVLKAWDSSVDVLPECDLRTRHLQRVKAFAEGLPEGFAKVLPKGIREGALKSMPNREQEQEQEPLTTLRTKDAREVDPPVDESFEEFWEIYPKKRAKESARRAWKKIRGDREVLLEAIDQALQWQCKTPEWTKDGGQFVPYPASYLHAHGWEDSPEVTL